MSTLNSVPGPAIPSVWEHVAPFVASCLAKSKEHRFDLGDMLRMLLDSDLQLWLVVENKAIKCVVITQVQQYPKAKEAVLFMVSGEYPEDWSEITDELLRWAHSIGCSHFSAYMRRGLLKRMGWDERQTYCVRGLA